MLVSFEDLNFEAFLMDSWKNENIDENRDKNENIKKNRLFVTYPTPFSEARIESELAPYISARSMRFCPFYAIFFFSKEHINIFKNKENML